MQILGISNDRCVFPRPHGRAQNTPGKADKVWAKLDLKFSKRPPEEFLTPIGRVLESFEARAARMEFSEAEELAYLEATQELELATSLETYLANKVPFVALDDPEAPEVPEGAAVGTPYLSPELVSRMTAAAEHERFITCNGQEQNRRKMYFEIDDDGDLTVKIGRVGRMRFAALIEMKKSFISEWRERFGALPTADDIREARERIRAAHGHLVEAEMTPSQKREFEMSRKLQLEDWDPYRSRFHGDLNGPKPVLSDYEDEDGLYDHLADATCPPDRRDKFVCNEFYHDIAIWQAREERLQTFESVGYAGPSGLIGTDIDAF